MKWFWHLLVMRLKITAKTPLLWLLLAVSGLFSLIPIHAFQNQVTDKIPMAYVNLDGGAISQEFISEITIMDGVTFFEADSFPRALRQLAIGRYEGIVVIEENFSETISQGVFKKVMTIYVSPSSSAAPIITEYLAEKVLELWAESFMLQDFANFMAENDMAIAPDTLDAMEDELAQIVQGDDLISFQIYGAGGQVTEPEAQGMMTGEDAVRQAVLYFAALSVIFVFTSGRWVIDQRQSSIGQRMNALGMAPLVSVLASTSATAFLCTGVLGVLVIGSGLYFSLVFGFTLTLIGLGLLYFLAIIGIALAFFQVVRESTSLFLISPLAILINSLLGGMFYPLPEWAVIWQKVSILLPGRMLTLALKSGNIGPLGLGALFYLCLGVLVSRRRMREA